jgi:hypothetical protein
MMECNHADQELQNDMEQVWEEMMDSIDLRKRKVREENENFDSTLAPGIDYLPDLSKPNITTRKQTRLNQKEERKRGRKPPTATLDFQLKENEMYEDLWVMRKVIIN